MCVKQKKINKNENSGDLVVLLVFQPYPDIVVIRYGYMGSLIGW